MNLTKVRKPFSSQSASKYWILQVSVYRTHVRTENITVQGKKKIIVKKVITSGAPHNDVIGQYVPSIKPRPESKDYQTITRFDVF